MPDTRRVAVHYRPDPLDLRQRETLRGIARYARDAGHWQLALDPFAHHHEPARYHGILAAPHKGQARGLRRCPVPIVCVTWGLVQQRLLRVVERRHVAGRLAARHLADQGCRTFAYVGFAKQTQSRVEREGFTHELRRRGLRVSRARTFVTYATSRAGWQNITASLADWLERLSPPAGLLVAQPGFARVVADLALQRGLRIPHDLAIVAADDDPVLCSLDPPLTAVHCDYADLGHRAAELLDRLIDGAPRPRGNVLIEPTLVPRRSTDRRSAADPLVAQALTWIERHCTERIDWHRLDTGQTDRLGPRHVAQAVGLSQRALEQRMRRARGTTILQELTIARVEHARIQLERSNSPIVAIAHHSGFGSPAAMLRAFHRHLGTTPSAIRTERGRRDA